jgi:hypothetical protein
MNVHITCTPEFSPEKLDEIVSLLKSIPGGINFDLKGPITEAQARLLNRKFENPNQISSLSFEEFFDLVQGYRVMKGINANDFVIMISSIRNNRNWFSAFNKKNIFIHGDEWDLISEVDSKFGLAHQCVGNIFHSLLELNTSDFHEPSIGCLSDFCRVKRDILMKLQSANICQSCYERSRSQGISDLIMTHIISILEEIRKEFVIARRFSQEVTLEPVIIDDDGNITIGGKTIVLQPIPRVVYISFLKNINGIPSKQLCENKDKFESIYRIIKPRGDVNSINKMLCFNNTGKYRLRPQINTYRSRIKEAIEDKLGQILANYYCVNLVEEQNQSLLKVNLKEELLDISPRFN